MYAKEGFFTRVTCDRYCGIGALCFSDANLNPRFCTKLTYTNTNTNRCNTLAGYDSPILYNPSVNSLRLPNINGVPRKVCINYKYPSNPDPNSILVKMRAAVKPENIAKCRLDGEIAMELLDNNGTIMRRPLGTQPPPPPPTADGIPSIEPVRMTDDIRCIRLQPTRTGQCIITPTAVTAGFTNSNLNPRTSEVRDTRANTDICITERDPNI